MPWHCNDIRIVVSKNDAGGSEYLYGNKVGPLYHIIYKKLTQLNTAITQKSPRKNK